MNYRNLGATDVKVSEISFGCWTMGGLNWVNGNAIGWAEVDEDQVTAAIKVGLDEGVIKPAVLQSWAHAMDDRFIRPGTRVAKLMEQ